MEWDRLQVVDLFLPCLLSVDTAPNASSGNIHWIKDDLYDRWYRGLDTVASYLVVEVVKLLVDAEASVIAALKDKEITQETATKAQKELFRPAMTKLLRTYMTFAMDSADFTKASIEEVVIRKNSMRAPLNPTFEESILKSGRRKDRDVTILESDNIFEDQLAPSTRDQELMDMEALEEDLEIEEEERSIQDELQFSHARDIVKIQASSGVAYEKDHDYRSLNTPALAPEDESALAKAYISKGPVGRILMICHDIKRERKRLNALLMAGHRYDKVLNRELANLAEEEEFCRSTEQALMNQREKNREKEALVKQKRADANAPIFNPKTACTASTLQSTQPHSASTPTEPTAIEGLDDSDEDKDDATKVDNAARAMLSKGEDSEFA